MQRTPNGETGTPRLSSSLETRVWPQAGWSMASHLRTELVVDALDPADAEWAAELLKAPRA